MSVAAAMSEGFVGPAVTNFTAPIFFGIIIASFLYGTLTVQLYIYHTSFPDDKRVIKTLVYGVYIFECIIFLLSVIDSYRKLAAGFGNRQVLDTIDLALINSAVLGSLLTTIVQTFYCYRIWVLSRKAWPLVCFTLLLAWVVAAVAVYSGISGTLAGRFSAIAGLPPSRRIATLVALIGAVIIDVIITGSITVLLLRGKSELRPQSRFLIKRILLLTAETNFLSSAVAILLLTLILSVPFPWHICPAMVLSRIYSNSLLLLLNNRKHAREGLRVSAHVSTSISSASRHNALSMQIMDPPRKTMVRTFESSVPQWEGELVHDSTIRWKDDERV